MADVSNLKINETLNVERPTLRKSLKQEIKIENLRRRNLFISKDK